MTTYFLTDDALKEHIRDTQPAELADKCYIMDGLSPAAIGVHTDGEGARVVYSYQRILRVLQDEQGMTPEDAVDHYCYNIERSIQYMGHQAPIIIEEFTL